MGIGERVRNKVNVLEAGEKFEEWVAGLGEKKFVAGIAEQAECVGVGFAGAGGEEEGFGLDGGAMVIKIVAGDFLASRESALWLRMVDESRGILECGENSPGIVVKTALRGIGRGEIEEGNSSGAEFVERQREAVAGERPVSAVRKHGSGCRF